MTRLGWLVALALTAGPAWAQERPRPVVERPQLPGERRLPAGRTLDKPLELKVHAVVDGLVLGGQELPKAALEGAVGQLFARVAHESEIRPNVIFGNRLYRSYYITAPLTEADFARHLGNTVRVKVAEQQAGRRYSLVAIVP